MISKKKYFTCSYLKFLILVFICNNIFAIDPKKDYIKTPKDFNIEFTEIFINNKDNKLCVWVCKPEIKSKKNIILVYGDYGNMSYYLEYIKLYIELGYNVISFDYRGFGKSSEFLTEKNVLFYEEYSSDLRRVIQFCQNDLPFQELGIVSLSMGTIITAIATQNKKLDFIITEGCVYNPADVVKRIHDKNGKNLIFKNNHYDWQKIWKNVNSRILVLVASLDDITTIEDAKSIISSNPSRKLAIYSGEHLSSLSSEEKIFFYKNQIQSFINEKKS